MFAGWGCLYSIAKLFGGCCLDRVLLWLSVRLGGLAVRAGWVPVETESSLDVQLNTKVSPEMVVSCIGQPGNSLVAIFQRQLVVGSMRMVQVAAAIGP
jgi:hypothetical protein